MPHMTIREEKDTSKNDIVPGKLWRLPLLPHP